MLESLKQEDLQFQELSPEEKQARGILARLTGPIASFTKGTRNGRKYSDKLWEKAFDSPLVKEMFKNGGLPGELQHPENRSETDPTKIAIMMPEPPKKDSKGHLVASVDILDTPCGQIAYQLGKYGFKFGISSRGEGDLIQDFSGEESVDPDTYTLNAFDLVLIPACEDARLQFNESLEKSKNNLKTILGESLSKASDIDRKVMEEALNELDIENNIQYRSTYKNIDIYFDPQDQKYIVYGMDGDEEKFNSESNAQKYIDRFITEPLNEEQIGRDETKSNEIASDILKNKPENKKEIEPKNETEVSVNINTDQLTKEEKDKKQLNENLYKGFLILQVGDCYSIFDADGLEIADGFKEFKDAKNAIEQELSSWGPEQAFGGVKLFEAIEDEEPERKSWDTDFHRLDIAYNHNFKQFDDRDKYSGLIRDFIDDLDSFGKEYEIYYHKTDPGCTIFFQESLNEAIEWADLNSTEQSAAETALVEINNGSSIEDAVHGAVAMYNEENANPDYEDEEFYLEEANFQKVLNYVKSHNKSIPWTEPSDEQLAWEEHNLSEGPDRKKAYPLFVKFYNAWPERMESIMRDNNVSEDDYEDLLSVPEDIQNILNKEFLKSVKDQVAYESKNYRGDVEIPTAAINMLKKYKNEVLNEGKYTKDELWDKFGTDDLDIINAGNEETVELKESATLNKSVNIAADSDGAIIEQLQNILKQNRSLEEKIKKLQEKLSVGYAKEIELKEELDTYKQKVSKLSKKTKEIKVLQEKLSKTEQLIKNNSTQVEDKISNLNESILSKDFENKDLRKDISVLNESLDRKNSKIRSLNEQIDKYKDLISSKDSDIEQLKEQYETGQKDLEQLKTQYSKKIEHQNQIIEKYQRVAKNSVKRYIESQAIRLGVKSDEIVNRLPKNYSFNDIDKICEDLQEYKFNMSNLPFSKYTLNENLKVTAKNIRKDLIEANPEDEITDYDLKIAEAFL